MATSNKKIFVFDDSDSDLVSSMSSNTMDSSSNISTLLVHKSRTHGKSIKNSPISSYDGRSLVELTAAPKMHQSTLTPVQSENFRQRIQQEYEILEGSEASYCYYIKDSSKFARAKEHLRQSHDGTFFVCCAKENEMISDIRYYLTFVCHKELAEVGICCDKEERMFWFHSGYGHGSEVPQLFTGIDTIIDHKKRNIFSELKYGFHTFLSKPIDSQIVPCIPLPDEVRAKPSQTTLIHDLVSQGFREYFSELLRISQTVDDQLQEKSKFILNKINGKNEHGQTALIIAIRAKNYSFVKLLLDNHARINMTDTQRCSPIHHACRQADSKMLNILLRRSADPHYFNWKETTNGISNLSAFHYLAMARGATSESIERCARYLLKYGCPLMPLTRQGKSPFDIAQLYKNNAYECVKKFCIQHEFNTALPIEVSSRDEAKTKLHRLVRSQVLEKTRSSRQRNTNSESSENEGVFSFYRIQPNKTHRHGEFGICLYHHREVTVYPISEKHQARITNPIDPRWSINYKYCLITDTVKDDRAPVIVFRTCEELIFSHTKYAGILPIKLKKLVRQEKNEKAIIVAAKTLLLSSNQSNDEPNDEEADADENDDTKSITVTSIDRIHLSKIQSAELLNENQQRFIWLAKVRLEFGFKLSIVIKEYLPREDLESYKQHRLTEYNALSRAQNTTEERSYRYSSRTRLQYKEESQLLLKELRNHPYIIHAFLCEQNSETDLRIFMEYLPMGNLHAYLENLKSTSMNLLANAYYWIYQLAQVMGYLSNKKIIHGDLATRNILLRNEHHIKLSDFGLSCLEGIVPEAKHRAVSVRWAAPECLEEMQVISSASEVWSFAVVIWEIYSLGASPYQDDISDNPQDVVRLLKRYLIEYNRRLTAPHLCSKSMYDLMYRCWNGNASKRPRFVDIINEFNGMSVTNDCITPFTSEERQAWRIAREYYLITTKSVPTATIGESEYVSVQDCDTDSIIMEL